MKKVAADLWVPGVGSARPLALACWLAEERPLREQLLGARPSVAGAYWLGVRPYWLGLAYSLVSGCWLGEACLFPLAQGYRLGPPSALT